VSARLVVLTDGEDNSSSEEAKRKFTRLSSSWGDGRGVLQIKFIDLSLREQNDSLLSVIVSAVNTANTNLQVFHDIVKGSQWTTTGIPDSIRNAACEM
jgi:hypothetical protein